MSVAILSFRQELWDNHVPAIEERGFRLHRPVSYEDVATIIEREKNGAAPVKLVVIDLPYNWDTLRKSVVRILNMDRQVNVALVTSLKPDEVYEETKGLGLLLAMPTNPSVPVVTLLLNNLQAVMSGKRVITREAIE
ncbi:hypothetical protein LJC48_02425 [Desulfovibrio sp. OttesenSCG-928-C06]|nr:hypothetical protein [Desulfovibrio sp. OttesenSCG-928-C06]